MGPRINGSMGDGFVRLGIESLEDRITPGKFIIEPVYFIGGELVVAPIGTAAHVFEHVHPSVGVGGLNMAEAQSGVVTWTPTDQG